MSPEGAGAGRDLSRVSISRRFPAEYDLLSESGAQCRAQHRGEEELDAMEFLSLIKDKMKLVEMDQALVNRPLMKVFRAAKKNATKFCKWR